MDINNLEVIIPVYNEQDNIPILIQGLRRVIGDSCRITLVNDASTDKTVAKAREVQARIISHPYRIGNGAAIKTGLRQSNAEIVVLMDADLQHLPEDLPGLLAQIDNFDMVIGARAFSGLSLRNLANRAYNLFASYITNFKIRDLTSGFRVLRRRDASRFLYLLPNGFSYPTTLTLAFLKTGRAIKYVDIANTPRVAGKSKINLLQDGARFFMIITRIATFFSPFKVFLPISIFFFIVALVYYLYTYLVFHRFTNMSALLFTTSVTIFMLGLISEQVSQLRMDRTEEGQSQ
ncbi:MAG: glycosyltransferase family 2 protein [Candidatus Omnitrophota bacterium]